MARQLNEEDSEWERIMALLMSGVGDVLIFPAGFLGPLRWWKVFGTSVKILLGLP